MHHYRVQIALSVVIDRVSQLGRGIPENLKLLKVEVHWNWRARNVVGPPAKQHVWLHAKLLVNVYEVHRRVTLKHRVDPAALF